MQFTQLPLIHPIIIVIVTFSASLLGIIEVSPIADLEQVRGIVNRMFNSTSSSSAAASMLGRSGNGDGGGDAEAASSNGANHELRKGEEGVEFLSLNQIKLSSEWCFVDSCTAERFFRVDRAQEHLHYLTDIANECLFILDQDSPTMPPTPDDEVASPSILRPHISPSESR